jgi:hypothetical protein
VTSPISATRTAPRTGPIPGIFSIAAQPGPLASRVRVSLVNTLDLELQTSMTRRSESTRGRADGLPAGIRRCRACLELIGGARLSPLRMGGGLPLCTGRVRRALI